MTIRTTLAHATRQARMGTARATIREFSDDHLMQEVVKADVYHSETPSDFERWQMVGMTSVPLKQQEDPNQKDKKEENPTEDGDWNHNQPTGPAAEALMVYVGGNRSHPIALVDDRRVRPYEMSEGEGANYAPDGSEQMVLFKENGTYIMSLDGPSVKSKEKKTRFVSLRHVNKKMQSHKIEKKQESGGGSGGVSAQQHAEGGSSGQQKEKYKHEGESVNTEVRCTASRIEFRCGDKVVGYYDKNDDQWYFTAKVILNEATQQIKDKAPKIDHND